MCLCTQLVVSGSCLMLCTSKRMLRDGYAINETWSGKIIDFYHVCGFTFALPKWYWVWVTSKAIKKLSDDWWDPEVAKLPQLQGCNYKPPIAEATPSGTTTSPSFGRKLNLIVGAFRGGSFVWEKLLIGSVKNEPRIDRFLSRKIK